MIAEKNLSRPFMHCLYSNCILNSVSGCKEHYVLPARSRDMLHISSAMLWYGMVSELLAVIDFCVGRSKLRIASSAIATNILHERTVT